MSCIDDVFDLVAKVHWDQLSACGGTASHVPQALRGLIADDPAIRQRAAPLLDNYVVRQGDLFSSAAYVTPAAVQLLKCRPNAGQEELYDLLTEIVLGYANPGEEYVFCGGQDDPYYSHLPAAMRDLRETCASVIVGSVPVFCNDIQDGTKPDVQKHAIDLLDYTVHAHPKSSDDLCDAIMKNLGKDAFPFLLKESEMVAPLLKKHMK